jgi:hypothetical protein
MFDNAREKLASPTDCVVLYACVKEAWQRGRVAELVHDGDPVLAAKRLV